MKQIRAAILHIRSLTPTVVELTIIRQNGRLFFDFSPGQYVTLSFPTHERLKGERSFSIASAPTDRSNLRFGIRIYGRYTQALRDVRPGDPVMVGGPFGQFTFDPIADQSAVFFAGGIGITPFLSMIRYATNKQLPNDLTLLYSVRTLADAAFHEELNDLERVNPHFHALYAVSDGPLGNQQQGQYIKGRITREIVASKLNSSFTGRTYFFCGPPPFMKAMESILESLGVPATRFRTERFSAGSSALIEKGTLVPKFTLATWGAAVVILLGIIVRVERGRRIGAEAEAAATLPANVAVVDPAPATNAVPTLPVVANTAAPSKTPATPSAPTTPNTASVPKTTSRPAPSAPTPTNTAPPPTVQPKPKPLPQPVNTVPRTAVS